MTRHKETLNQCLVQNKEEKVFDCLTQYMLSDTTRPIDFCQFYKNQADCQDNIAIKSGNIYKCFGTQSGRFDCMIKVLVKQKIFSEDEEKDAQMCTGLKTDHNACFKKLISKYQNPYFCHFTSDSKCIKNLTNLYQFRDACKVTRDNSCYLQSAIKNKDSWLCGKIDNSYSGIKRQCASAFPFSFVWFTTFFIQLLPTVILWGIFIYFLMYKPPWRQWIQGGIIGVLFLAMVLFLMSTMIMLNQIFVVLIQPAWGIDLLFGGTISSFIEYNITPFISYNISPFVGIPFVNSFAFYGICYGFIKQNKKKYMFALIFIYIALLSVSILVIFLFAMASAG